MRHWRILGHVVIVETRVFTSKIEALLTLEEYRSLQLELFQRPVAGKVIPGTGGIRKLRWGAHGQGKRGGCRIVYFWHRDSATILMLFAYAKNEREDLTAAQREALRRVIEKEYP